MACDNLLLVHGRIGTLDIYTVAMMIWGVALYLRGWPLRAGIALGIGAAFKLVAPYAAAILLLLEVARVLTRGAGAACPPNGGRARRCGGWRSASSPGSSCSWRC